VGRAKIVGQVTLGLGVAAAVLLTLDRGEFATATTVPFLKERMIDLRFLYVPFIVVAITGFSNAVNLTDGLDGLAIGCVAFAAAAFAGLSYLSGHARFAEYLQILYLPGTGELTVFCASLFGASLGFLWYNGHPAEVFMGDTGSLALGGLLGTIAVATKHEIALAIIGGLFVLEAVSVIVQVVSFKLTGKRIFRMAPIHHHFEQLGWTEAQIVIRFWIIALVLALIGLSTLKLR
jgi:phospho-N-acetylmuramoyl-pentapeptide-transferase